MYFLRKYSGFEFFLYKRIDEVQSPLCTLFKTRCQACVAESAFLVTLDKALIIPALQVRAIVCLAMGLTEYQRPWTCCFSLSMNWIILILMTLAKSIFANQKYATSLQPLYLCSSLYMYMLSLEFIHNNSYINSFSFADANDSKTVWFDFTSDNSILYIGLVKRERGSMEIKQLTQIKAYTCPFPGKDVEGKPEDFQCL